MTEPTPIVPPTPPAPAPIEATVPPPMPDYLQPVHEDDTFTEYGLRTPDGQISWGDYRGNDLSTPQARYMMRIRLGNTARELGDIPEQFIARYQWVGRNVHKVTDRAFTDAGVVPIESEAAAPQPAEPPQNGQFGPQ